MSFLNPILFGAGLACVAIPIVIHLLMRRRRQPVRWAAMRFLVEAWRKQRRRVQLEQWLLLAARCLLLALLAVAFGQPVLRAAGVLGGLGPRTVHLVVDDSLVSALDVGGGRLLEEHQVRALALLSELDSSRGDRASLVTLAGPAEGRIVPPSNDLGAVARAIEALEPRASRADVGGALARLAELADSEANPEPATVALLTSWRGGALPGADAPVLPEAWSLAATAPASGRATNAAVVGVEPTRRVVLTAGGAVGGLSAPVRVRVARSGVAEAEASVDVVLWLEVGGSRTRVGEGRARFEAGQREAVAQATMRVEPSAVEAGPAVLVATVGADALPTDDQRRTIVSVRDQLRVGVAGVRRFGTPPPVRDYQPADWLRIALAPAEDALRRAAEGVELVELDPAGLERAPLEGLDAVWVTRPDRVTAEGWSRLGRLMDEGGLVVVCPPPAIGAQAWSEAFVRELAPGWSVGRMSEAHDRALVPAAPAVEPERLPLLALVRGELDELARTVEVRASLRITPGPGAEVLLALSGEAGDEGAAGVAPWVVAGQRSEGGRGAVVLIGSSMDLAWTDLPARALMVPLAQELTRQGVSRAVEGREATSGSALPAVGGAVSLVTPEGEHLAVTSGPAVWRDAGVLRATDARGATRALVAVNPDPAGSDVAAASASEVESWLGRAAPGRVVWLDGTEAKASESGAPLAAGSGRGVVVWALAAALVLALAEVVLARRFSHAEVGREARGAA